MTVDFKPGLEGVLAARTRLSAVDGEAGSLIVGGFPIEALAGNACFEEVLWLLWHDALPDAKELAAFRARLQVGSALPPEVLAVLRLAANHATSPLEAVRLGIEALALSSAQAATDLEDALLLVAATPAIVGAYWRMLNRLEPVDPRPGLGYAANYLYMLNGEAPSEARSHALDTYLCTVADHGMNASTFTARVIMSTRSDMVSAIVGAIGALKGPLHGGAPGPALDVVFDVQREGDAEAYLRRKIEAGERFMGFGHRVYKVRDPRADVLKSAAAELYRSDGDRALFELAGEVESTALRLLEAYKPGRRLQTNVEYYTALLLHGVDLPTDLFTPTFAVGRMAGWTAHCLEQAAENRLIRPQSEYVGPRGRPWVDISSR